MFDLTKNPSNMFIRHELKIGQRIYDEHDDRWGEVLLIGGEEKDRVLEGDGDTDVIVLYKPDDSDGECETFAENCYPYYDGGKYNGMDLCYEIYQGNYYGCEFFCPEIREGCYKEDIDEK